MEPPSTPATQPAECRAGSFITDLILKMLRALTGPDWLLREELWLMYTCTCTWNQSLWREELWRMLQIKTCNLSPWMIC